MKKFLLFLTLIAAMTTQAQRKLELPLGDTPSQDFKIDMTDLRTKPGITVYLPEQPNGAAIIMCPGGGYAIEAADHEGHDMAQWMNDMGVTYIVLKYRLPDGTPEIPIKDAAEAIRLVRSKAQEWSLNPNKIGIMGASAGGHLASTVATHWSDSTTRPDFQILLYPVITMDDKYTHRGSRENLLGKNPTIETVKLYSNELQVSPQTPQAFIVLSGDDTGVSPINSISYYEALLNNKVPAAMHIYPTGGHGWGFRDYFPYKPQWTAELAQWLNQCIF